MSKEQSLIFYILLFVISASILITSLKYFNKKQYRRIGIIIALAIPTLVAGLRYGIGTDYWAYVDIFERITNGKYAISELIINYEPFHILVCKLLGLFNLPSYSVFIVYSFLTILFIYKGIEKQQDNNSILYMFLMYILTIFPYSFNLIREGLAIAIIFYSYQYLKVEKYNLRKVVILIFFATLVHYSSIIVLAFAILWIKLKRYRKKEIAIIILYVAFLISIYIIKFIIPENIVDVGTLGKVLAYLNTTKEIDIGLGLIAYNLPIFIIIAVYYKRLREINKDINLYIALYTVGVVLMHLRYINFNLGRMANQFLISQIVLLPAFIQIPRNKKHRIFVKWSLIIYIIYQFIDLFYINSGGQIFPYSTILSK